MEAVNWFVVAWLSLFCAGWGLHHAAMRDPLGRLATLFHVTSLSCFLASSALGFGAAFAGCATEDDGPLAAGECGDFVVLSTQYEIVADETVVIEDCYTTPDDGTTLDLSGCCPDGYVAVGLADSGTNVVCQGVCS